MASQASDGRSLQDTGQIDSIIHRSFIGMSFVTHVCYSNTNNEYILIVIFEAKDFESAFNAIDDKIIELEGILPNINIEPWILTTSEVRLDHLINTKTIFKKKNNFDALKNRIL